MIDLLISQTTSHAGERKANELDFEMPRKVRCAREPEQTPTPRVVPGADST